MITPASDAAYDVAIVGYGPVGATLAALLGRTGLAVAVIERAVDIYGEPRAVGFDHDAMRIFQRAGVADALAPHIAPFRRTHYLGVDGQVILRVAPTAPPYPLGWAPNYSFDQPGLERVLREAVARMPNVVVSLATEALAVEQSGEAARLTVRDATGAERRLAARFVVACDGATSPIRRALGITLESMDYDEPWIVVDLAITDARALARLPETNVQYCEPARPSTQVVCPGEHRRWEFMVLDGEPREGALDESRLWKLLARWVKPHEARIRRAAMYRFHALVAHDWRRERVLLAGDAAHQTPPFLAQGMCQGLRDAGNLAWKLEWVLRGRAPEALLDSYQAERRPHVIETTRIAKELGQIVSERDPARARARDARMLAEGGGEPRLVTRQDYIPSLTVGALDRDAPGAGKAFPQPSVRDPRGQPIRFDVLTAGARLVLDASLDARARATLEHAALGLGIAVFVIGKDTAASDALVDSDGLVADWLARHGALGALVRPDQIVFGGFADLAGGRARIDSFARQVLGRAPQLSHEGG